VIANFAAGVEVGKLGAATVSAEEVIEAFDEFEGNAAAAAERESE
jgi:D-beta-D-heptose 7-phosphate kinase/D-beta-D-heptose 1-phosphate adenosyltransferase